MQIYSLQIKLHFYREKSVTKFLYVESFSGRVVGNCLVNLTVLKWLPKAVPYNLEIYLKATIMTAKCNHHMAMISIKLLKENVVQFFKKFNLSNTSNTDNKYMLCYSRTEKVKRWQP